MAMTSVLSPTRYFPSITPRNVYTLSCSSAAMQVDGRDNGHYDDDDTDDLIALNAKIAALQTELAILQTKRHSLIQRHILRALTPPSDDKPSLPPVTRLAPELWGFIFELALDASQNSPLSVPSNATLLSIASVCRRWRSIAHSTPQLWTNVVLTMQQTKLFPSSNSVRNFVSLLTNWIPRSGALPFHLYILDSPPSIYANKPEDLVIDLTTYRQNALFQQAIETLYNHLGRCRSIRVDEGMTDIWNILFSALRSLSAPLIAPNLHTILLSYAIPAPRTTPRTILHSLDLTSRKLQLPSLHTLSITSPMAIPTLTGLSIDYSQLRVLKWRSRGSFYGPPGLTALTALLAECINLEECEIDQLPTSHRSPSNAITLPYLKKLDIKFALSDDPNVLLSIIHAPELEHLLLEQTLPISHVLGLSGAVSEFLRANASASANAGTSTSSHGLRSLTLTGLILKESDVTLFQALDNPQSSHTDLELTFRRCFLNDAFVLHLREILGYAESTPTQPTPLSRLTNLTLHSTACNYQLLNSVSHRFHIETVSDSSSFYSFLSNGISMIPYMHSSPYLGIFLR